METTIAPAPDAVQAGPMDVPDPQVPERATRRTYTAKYKRDVLAEYDACDRAGKGALLRREGLYTSLITAWREQRDRGALEAPVRPALRRPRPRSGKPPACAARTPA